MYFYEQNWDYGGLFSIFTGADTEVGAPLNDTESLFLCFLTVALVGELMVKDL